MKVHVIQKIGYEYNDEYYDRPDSDGGKPVIGYKDKEKALAEAKRLNDAVTDKEDYVCEDGCYLGLPKNSDGYHYYDQFYEVVEINVPDADIQLVSK